MKTVVLISVVLVGIAIFLATRSSAAVNADVQPTLDSDASKAKLEKWKATIDDNVLPAIRVILTGQRTSSPTASKVGGDPFWPSGKSYPTSGNGDPLHFLVQINFAEISEPPSGYPTSGLLQVFIAADDLYGSDFTKPGAEDTKNQDYEVVFHAEVENHVGAPQVALSEDDYLPFSGESGVRFESISSRASPLDYRFDALLPGVTDLYDES